MLRRQLTALAPWGWDKLGPKANKALLQPRAAKRERRKPNRCV